MDSEKNTRLTDLRSAYEFKKERLDVIMARIQKMMDEGESEDLIEQCAEAFNLDRQIMQLRAIELEIEALEIKLKIR